MKRDGPVLIAAGGSEHSAGTLEWGLDEAELRGSPVLIVQAFEEPRDPALAWLLGPRDFRGEAGAKQHLAELRASIGRHRPGLRIGTRVMYGPPLPALRALSADAQLVVVGPDGHSHLAAHALCPVAVVRAASGSHAPGAPVVVGVDGSPVSLAAAHAAAREALMRGAPLTVVHARPPTSDRPSVLAALPPSAGVDPEDQTHPPAVRTATILRADHAGLDVHPMVSEGDPVHVLLDAGDKAALLVVGSRGLGPFRGALLGSVSTRLLREAAGTVLVVGPAGSGDVGPDPRVGQRGKDAGAGRVGASPDHGV